MLYQLLFACLVTAAAADGSRPQHILCKRIDIPFCSSTLIGYDLASIPNDTNRGDLQMRFRSFQHLVEVNCNVHVREFLCRALLPECNNGKVKPVCRSMCETVKSGCLPILTSFNFEWPEILDCSLFPKENCAGGSNDEASGSGEGQELTTPTMTAKTRRRSKAIKRKVARKLNLAKTYLNKANRSVGKANSTLEQVQSLMKIENGRDLEQYNIAKELISDVRSNLETLLAIVGDNLDEDK